MIGSGIKWIDICVSVADGDECVEFDWSAMYESGHGLRHSGIGTGAVDSGRFES